MTVTTTDLNQLNDHWAIKAIGSARIQAAHKVAKDRLIQAAIGNQLNLLPSSEPHDLAMLERIATAYEVAAIEGLPALLHPDANEESVQRVRQAQAGAYQAYELRRALPLPDIEIDRVYHVLHLSALAYSGERWAELRLWLKNHREEIRPSAVVDVAWDERLLLRLYEGWVLLLRKDQWNDLSRTQELIVELRDDQRQFEAEFLSERNDLNLKAAAHRLIALYNWAKATEILAQFMLQGQPIGVHEELDAHFEAANKAAVSSHDPNLDVLLRWLHVAARKMVLGSLWWIAQSTNSQSVRFVEGVIKTRGLFELLPPQRAALQDQGLLDVANRAVVIDLPTSGGKTVLAQFRILQALNQFDADKGWVAYVAPTRALVSQLTRRLRADFSHLGIRVEQLTAAVDVDSFEEALLIDEDSTSAFHVLVTTPEKLHLVIRNKKIDRPMALIVMDEAQNIEDEERGLRIELLLATVKRDCPSTNFLLMMPFVPNAFDLARWLAPESGKAISFGTSAWQPNDRVVGMFSQEKNASARGAWTLNFETLTSPRSIKLDGKYQVGPVKPLTLSYSNSKSLSTLTGAMAKVFSERGTSVAVARTIADVWSMARKISADFKVFSQIPPEIGLVQRYLASEISPQFELIEMLSRGVGVHHAGLPDEVRSLIEWLTEEGKLRVLCATTTIAQGLNFPVSSVFLSSYTLPTQYKRTEMPYRSFWNLAGRAGRIGQDSVGVIGIAAGNDPDAVRAYVSAETGNLISRLVKLLEDLEASSGGLSDLSTVIDQDQWSDFRSYIAHLWNEKRSLDGVLAETEQVLRNTFGYRSLQSKDTEKDRSRANALLEATKGYARRLAEHPENALLADSTGFAPEGVRAALLGLNGLERPLTLDDWQPSSLFGSSKNSALPQLIGVMMKIPEIRNSLEKLSSHGSEQSYVAQMAQAWVSGRTIQEIAQTYFSESNEGETNLTQSITDACKGIYRVLANAGTWGLSALTKMPTSGIDFDEMPEETRRLINNLPAMLYHGVNSEHAILMRMNSVPRSIADRLGNQFLAKTKPTGKPSSPSKAREFLRTLDSEGWRRAVPEGSTMSGADFRDVWAQLSGERA
jgi:replicative superfamily II helicase